MLFVYLGFLFLLNLVFVDCLFLGIYPFLLCCPICWHIVIYNSPLKSFFFLVAFAVTSSFLFIIFSESPFFPLSLAKGLLILTFQKKQLLVLLIFFLLSISFFCFHLYYLLSSANLGLVCSLFSRSLRCNVRSFDIGIYHCKFSSYYCLCCTM